MFHYLMDESWSMLRAVFSDNHIIFKHLCTITHLISRAFTKSILRKFLYLFYDRVSGRLDPDNTALYVVVELTKRKTTRRKDALKLEKTYIHNQKQQG